MMLKKGLTILLILLASELSNGNDLQCEKDLQQCAGKLGTCVTLCQDAINKADVLIDSQKSEILLNKQIIADQQAQLDAANAWYRKPEFNLLLGVGLGILLSK